MKRDIGTEILEGIREIKLKKLADKCKQLIECDTARISKYDKMYLIIGFNRNTKNDPGQWIQQFNDGTQTEKDWNYVQEKVVASGKTEDELIESAKEYARLCTITMTEYLQELAEVNK